MPQSEMHILISGIVDRKLEIFKTDIQLQLLPIKIAVESHDRQFEEIRHGTVSVLHAVAELKGMYKGSLEEQRRQHAENTHKADLTLERLNEHLGEHTGESKHKSETEKQEDRISDRRRSWLKVGLGAASGGIIKWLHDHFHGLHLK